MEPIKFDWDEDKRLSNIKVHGLDFMDVWQLFSGDHIIGRAKPGRNGEERFLATGFIFGIYTTVIYTMLDDVARIISLRRARRNERRDHQALHGG